MNNEQNEKMELNLDNLEKVVGGGLLEDLCNKIKRDGRKAELLNVLHTQGKAAATNLCCSYYPEHCSVCAAAVSLQ